jgi:hypothetical protein
MSVGLVGMAVAPDAAGSWVLASLQQGSSLSAAVAAHLWKPGSARVLGANALDEASAVGFEHGGRATTSDADLAARRLFEAARSHGVKTLIVEDDLRRRGDPSLTSNVVYFGERVLHMTAIEGDVSAAVQMLRSGASGYPLNGFLCDKGQEDLGLIAGGEVDNDQAAAIVAATQIVIVAAYDAEAYLVWLRPDWQ